MNQTEQKSKSMPFNKGMAEAVDRWFENGGRIGNPPLQVGGRVNFTPPSQSKGAGDNQSGTETLIIAKGAQCAN